MTKFAIQGLTCILLSGLLLNAQITDYDFSETEKAIVFSIQDKIVSRLPNILKVRTDKVAIKVNRESYNVTLQYKTTYYKKKHNTKSKPISIDTVSTLGPYDDGFIITIGFQRKALPNQAVFPSSSREPYGYSDHYILIANSTFFEINLGYSYVTHQNNIKTNSFLAVPPGQHKHRISTIIQNINKIISE